MFPFSPSEYRPLTGAQTCGHGSQSGSFPRGGKWQAAGVLNMKYYTIYCQKAQDAFINGNHTAFLIFVN
ncbi:hypothetical protein DRA42_04395 [Ethanoligenens harbinense]|nr:hypothetical protein DRA42_04395 [Ethanoligenens harbinense]